MLDLILGEDVPCSLQGKLFPGLSEKPMVGWCLENIWKHDILPSTTRDYEIYFHEALLALPHDVNPVLNQQWCHILVPSFRISFHPRFQERAGSPQNYIVNVFQSLTFPMKH